MKSIARKHYRKVLGFFISSLILLMIGVRVFIQSVINNSEHLLLTSTVIAVIAFALLIAAIVFGAMLVYRMWHTLRESEPRVLGAGKAVGFLFIPIFNIYWIFIALTGYSEQLRRVCEVKGYKGVKYPSKNLSLIANILFIISLYPKHDLGFLVLIGVILYLVYLFQCARSVEQLEHAKESYHKVDSERLSKELESMIDEEEIEDLEV